MNRIVLTFAGETVTHEYAATTAAEAIAIREEETGVRMPWIATPIGHTTWTINLDGTGEYGSRSYVGTMVRD